MSLAKLGINMKNISTLKDLWENLDEQEKKNKEKVKGRGEGYITLVFVSYSCNCGGRKFIVSLKDYESPMA